MEVGRGKRLEVGRGKGLEVRRGKGEERGGILHEEVKVEKEGVGEY